NQNELSLSDQVGFARLVDQLRDFPHRFVHRHPLELSVKDQPKRRPSAQTTNPPISSERPGTVPKNLTCERSGIMRFASPPGLCSTGTACATPVAAAATALSVRFSDTP